MAARSSVLITVVLAFGTSCSSIPGMPNAGAGSHFNLATVAYVDSRDGEITEQVLGRVMARLPETLEAAIADERKRLQAVETMLVAQQSQLMDLARRMDESEQSMTKFSDEVRKQIDGLEALTSQIQSMTSELASQVDALPSDTLRELDIALEAHLSRTRPAPAPAPKQDPAPATSPGESGGGKAP